MCAGYGPVGSDELAVNILKALGQNKYAALMMNHGAVCVGRNFEEAFIVSDFLEKGAKTAAVGSLLGDLITREPGEILDEKLTKNKV